MPQVVWPGSRDARVAGGGLEAAAAPRLDELMCAERETVLDLSALTFMDSTGIAVLIRAERLARANGWNLEIRNPSPQALRVVQLSGVVGHLGLSTD